MALTPEEKAKLIQAYEPIMYFHPDEKFVPVNPRTYIESSALWPIQPVGDKLHEKSSWGEFGTHPAFPGIPGREKFPRRPSILRGGLSLNPADDQEGNNDSNGDGTPDWYLGHSDPSDARGPRPYLTSNENQGRALFLAHAGWAEDGDNVTETSKNEACDPDKLQGRWENEQKLKDNRNWYYAEVEELDTLGDLLGRIKGGQGVDVGAILKDKLFGGGSWFIWYHFLYPVHLEGTRLCEQMTGAGNNGNYEGDWNSIGIMVRREGNLPWDQATFPAPEFIGFGMRGRGFIENLIPFFRQQMAVYKWQDIQRVDTHAKVYVALGSHNNYSIPGPQPSPSITDAPCNTAEDLNEQIEDLKDQVEDLKDTATAIAVTVVKIAAGAGIGALFGGVGALVGAVVGGIAAAIEAAVNSSDDESDSPSAPPPTTPDEQPPLPNTYGLVITPDVLKAQATVTANTQQVEVWAKSVTTADALENHLVDRTGSQQLWWPTTIDRDDMGYNGRWGVVVTNDPRDRRSGIPFPDFKTAFLIDFVTSLHGGT
jgi:hypothetical protein